jgi:hypothetical protein
MVTIHDFKSLFEETKQFAGGSERNDRNSWKGAETVQTGKIRGAKGKNCNLKNSKTSRVPSRGEKSRRG